MKDFKNYEKYVFVFAHPDDEIFSVVTIRDLIKYGKEVHMVYLTNGDFLGNDMGKKRESELEVSMKLLRVAPEHFTMLGFSEKTLIGMANEVLNKLVSKIENIDPGCVVSHAYEGGHTGHDFTSFCSNFVAKRTGADFWTFPAYSGPPDRRRWNVFMDERSPDYSLTLNESDKEFKLQVAKAHASQKEYFEEILQSDDASNFLDREVLRYAGNKVDYTNPLTGPAGYNTKNSPSGIEELQAVISQYSSEF